MNSIPVWMAAGSITYDYIRKCSQGEWKMVYTFFMKKDIKEMIKND